MQRSVVYILQPRPKIVGYGVSFGDIPCIPEDAPFDPAQFGAETVVLPARLLTGIWDTVWTPVFPPVVLTGDGFGELTESDRHLIWRRWGVPVYEQRLSPDGAVIAEECDAHDGLHVRPGADLPSEHRRCPCGYTGPLLTREPARTGSA